MGYSDIAPFGAEIRTPNLQALADRGLAVTSFYTAPTCSPARSMLLSGNDNHVAGLGTMGEMLDATTNLRGQPGYEGYLNFSVAPLPELLLESGYHTYMTGKWHLGAEPGQMPSDRGFEETYALISGGASHWSDKKPVYPGEGVEYFANGVEVGSSDEWVRREFDNSYANLGRRGSGIEPGPGWAQASMSPFRLYKSFTAEGGIRAPFIAAGQGVEQQRHSGAMTHIMDIAPTVLEMAGVTYPDHHRGQAVTPMLGKSMRPLLAGERDQVRSDREYLAWEMFGNRAVRQRDWKLSWIGAPEGAGRWELYDLANDPGETVDLCAKHEEKCSELKGLWSDYQRRNGVIMPEFKAK